MFESLDNRPMEPDSEVEETPPPEARTTSGFRIWALLVVLLIFSSIEAVYNWNLASEDAKIVAREKAVEGHIYRGPSGKGSTVRYSFSFQGADYRAIEDNHPRMSIGDAVTVYLDSDNPRINSLVEYRMRSQQRHSWMIASICISASSVLGLAMLWGLNALTDKMSKEETST